MHQMMTTRVWSPTWPRGLTLRLCSGTETWDLCWRETISWESQSGEYFRKWQELQVSTMFGLTCSRYLHYSFDAEKKGWKELCTFIGLYIHCITKLMRARITILMPCYVINVCIYACRKQFMGNTDPTLGREAHSPAGLCQQAIHSGDVWRGQNLPHSEGVEWEGRDYCQLVSWDLPWAPQVHKILSQVEQTDRDRILLSLEDRGNSKIQDI